MQRSVVSDKCRAIRFPFFFPKANSVFQNGYFRFFSVFQKIPFFSQFFKQFPFFFQFLLVSFLLYFPENFSFFEYIYESRTEYLVV